MYKRRWLSLFVLLFALVACSDADTPPNDAPGFVFTIDPQSKAVSLKVADGALSTQAQRVLVPGEDLALISSSVTFMPDLEIKASFKNVADNVGFAQAFFFEASGSNYVSSTEPSVSEGDLGGDGVLSPGETTTELTFQVEHKGEPFNYFVTAYADVREVKELRLEQVADGLQKPLLLTHAGEADRSFIVQQTGQILVLEDGTVQPEPLLDIENKLSCCGERGLLGLAFPPNYAQSGLFYLNYTDTSGDTVVAEYDANADDVAASEQILLTIQQPFGNHNGGHMAFGPGGMLYIGTGDGGSGGDPQGNGQDLSTLLGKLLRIDVSGESYTVPQDNPFVSTEGARPEIWAYGLRNPWRFSFDRETGDLYIGDVGQNAYEEISYQSADSTGGENYGWNIMEGFHCYSPDTGCDESGLTLPILEYPHSEGNSVTGGYVYRGEAVPELVGKYIYGDFGRGTIWAAEQGEDGSWNEEVLLDSGMQISSFGEDASGELYVVNYSGSVHRFAPANTEAGD